MFSTTLWAVLDHILDNIIAFYDAYEAFPSYLDQVFCLLIINRWSNSVKSHKRVTD